MKVKILDKIIHKLNAAREPCFGYLYGNIAVKRDEIYILALQRNSSKLLLSSLPVGFDLFGFFDIKTDDNPSKQLQYLPEIFVFISLNLQTRGPLKFHLVRDEKVEDAETEVITEEQIFKDFAFLRCQGEARLQCDYDKQALYEAITNLKKSCKSDCMAFKFADSKILLTEARVIGIESTLRLGHFVEGLQSSEGNTKKKGQMQDKPKFVFVESLWRATKEKNISNIKHAHAPVCIVKKDEWKVIDTIIDIDTVLVISKDMEMCQLYTLFVKSVCRFLDLVESNLGDFIKSNKDYCDSFKLETFHFYPEDCGHFLTVLYRKHESDEDLKFERSNLHKAFMLNESLPVFRRANRYIFENTNSNSILVNPHKSVKPSDNGGQVSLVRGNYEYYHYCQNNADDSGWGCAYRSLQTLASWFKLQGYVNKDVPSIKDIQQCLVDIKDKPANFVGSKQWIGSTEVSFVLSTLLGIDSRILHVNSGEEMATMGPELMSHFENHGSPIMIGGGVLAHTILGVDYNPENGSLKFLILDPHYTGSEDLNIVINKGWCGWKGVNFWDKKSYYNMCLPQVPKEA